MRTSFGENADALSLIQFFIDMLVELLMIHFGLYFILLGKFNGGVVVFLNFEGVVVYDFEHFETEIILEYG